MPHPWEEVRGTSDRKVSGFESPHWYDEREETMPSHTCYVHANDGQSVEVHANHHETHWSLAALFQDQNGSPHHTTSLAIMRASAQECRVLLQAWMDALDAAEVEGNGAITIGTT